ncbi:MAG: sulfotransferase domain-containing protein [Ectothiorhodospiraceae bacterium]|nr:sulfotransferase domain-containing protein [Ectothiorhodospiraceae bacterium]
MSGTPRRATSVAELRQRFAGFVTPEGIARALAFRPRPSDVFVATYPKCGTTWVQQIVHGLRTGGAMDFAEITAAVPWLELAHDMGIDVEAEQAAAPRAFKTHLAYDRVPKGARYVYVIRDPRDVLVSLYRFLEGWFFERGTISLETFALEHFLQGTRSGRYWEHLRSWWPMRDRPEVLFLAYEDMLLDLEGTVRRIAEFAGIAPEPERIAVATRQASIDFMRAHAGQFDDHLVREARDHACGLPPGGDSAKVREGRSGGHLTAMTPRLERALATVWAETIAGPLGLASYDDVRAALARA